MTAKPPSSAIGPGLPITEVVRFVTVAGELCRLGFELVGQRAGAGETASERLAQAEASRHLGATLETWMALAPDSVGLRSLASAASASLEADPARPALATALETHTRSAALGLVRVVDEGAADLVAVSSPIADQAVVAGLTTVRVHLGAALKVLAGDAVQEATADAEARELAERLLNAGRKSFSSSLSVSKGNGSSHERWQ